MKPLLLSLAVLFALTTPLSAENFNPFQLAKVEEVHVKVIDTVEGNCLPGPKVLKAEAEQILRESGIKVISTMQERGHVLAITVAIHLNDATCVAAMTTELFRVEALADYTLGRVEASTVVGVHSGGRKGFQDHLRQVVSKYVQRLSVEILKAHVSRQLESSRTDSAAPTAPTTQ
jgi:hypothetical protein